MRRLARCEPDYLGCCFSGRASKNCGAIRYLDGALVAALYFLLYNWPSTLSVLAAVASQPYWAPPKRLQKEVLGIARQLWRCDFPRISLPRRRSSQPGGRPMQDLAFTRRQVVLASAASLTLSSIPRTAVAQTGAEGATLAEIVKIVVAIASSLQSQGAAKDEAAWRKSVEQSLRRIEAKVDFVIKSIRDLRMQLNEDANRRYLFERDAAFSAYRQRVETVLRLKVVGKKEKDELEDIAKVPELGLIDGVTKLSLNRDAEGRPFYPGFVVAMHGLGTLVLIAATTGLEAKHIQATARSMLNGLLRPCIDEKSKDSFAFSLAAQQESMRGSIAWLDARGNNKTWLVGTETGSVRRRGPDGPEVETIYVLATFTGNPDAGYTYKISKQLRDQDLNRYPGIGRVGPEPNGTIEIITRQLSAEAGNYRAAKAAAKQLQSTIDSLKSIIASVEKLA